jgi:peroxiredoxin
MVLLNSSEISMGTKLQDFNLPDTISGTNFSNSDLTKDLVVIAFICNHCPYVIRIIKDFSKLAQELNPSVQFVTISANDPNYRQEDSPENMKIFASEHNFSFPYLYDESQAVAKAFGAVCTPDIYAYKKHPDGYKLAYHARFEDLKKALNELLTQDQLSFEPVTSAGCSIKWKQET